MSSQPKYCPNCGAPLTAGATFCSSCGTQIPKTTGASPVPQGAPTYQPPASPATYQPPPPPYMQPPMYPSGSLGLGIILAIILGVTAGLIPLIGVFFAALIGGLVARGAGRGALVGVFAAAANVLIIAFIVSAIGSNFPGVGRFGLPLGELVALALVFLFVIYLILGVIGGVIGGAVRSRHSY